MNNKYLTLNLAEYFNIKLFLKSDEIEKSKKIINNIGARNQIWHLFNSGSLPESLSTTYFNGIPFLFPDKAFDQYDSISCENQTILLTEGDCKAIHLLGTAFDGVYCYEKLGLNYVNDLNYETDIYFKEWYYLPANTNWGANNLNRPECLIAIKCKHLSDLTDRCIYYNKCNVPKAAPAIKNIELPYNPDLYIFAITIEY